MQAIKPQIGSFIIKDILLIRPCSKYGFPSSPVAWLNFMMLVLTLIILTTAICYYFLKSSYRYWEKKGVRGPKPSLLVGNLGKVFILKDSAGETYEKFYKQYQNEEIVGIYRATSPVLLIRSPNLIKEITVKSFSSFHDNDLDLDKKTDPIFGRNPFALKGEEWKIVRAQLTPGFTSGKMKWLFPLLEEVCAGLVKFIEKKPEATNGDGYEAKELSMRFTLNNVASCAFGLQGKCFEEENSSFRQLAREFFSPDSWGVFSFWIMMMYPPLSKIVPLRLLTKPVQEKLVKMVSESVRYREENNIIRNDFLHIMSQLKKTCKEYEFTDTDVTAHAAGFFGDGYETSSIVLSFLLFNIAGNPDAQNQLREEVDAAFENGKISYEALQSLQYLDACVNESLRLHPPMFFLQKRCTIDFVYVPENWNKPLVIERGTPVIIPLYGLHHDPKYFKNPESYQPERFLGTNKENLTKYTFLPLGEGPRACLGQRFGLLQVKAAVAYIVHNFEMNVNKKTQLPLKFDAANLLTTPVGGLWLDFKKLRD